MKNRTFPSAGKRKRDLSRLPPLPRLPESVPAAEVARLLSATAELLEICVALTGTIDSASGWLVAHAADELTLGVYGVRRNRSPEAQRVGIKI